MRKYKRSSFVFSLVYLMYHNQTVLWNDGILWYTLHIICSLKTIRHWTEWWSLYPVRVSCPRSCNNICWIWDRYFLVSRFASSFGTWPGKVQNGCWWQKTVRGTCRRLWPTLFAIVSSVKIQTFIINISDYYQSISILSKLRFRKKSGISIC